MTESEELFERFCRERSISVVRLDEGPRRTPDYEMRLSGLRLAVEVKQLEANEDDKQFLEELRRRHVASRYENMERPRQAILDAAKQLRAHARGVIPAIAVLFDTLGGLLGYLDSDNIAQCLYGPERFHFAVPNPGEVIGDRTPHFLGASLGGRRIATEAHNTTLSAVGVLRFTRQNERLSLTLFHNRYAAIGLDPNDMRMSDVQHFEWREDGAGSMPRWVLV